jgi:outer membrane protein assembly factor BamA
MRNGVLALLLLAGAAQLPQTSDATPPSAPAAKPHAAPAAGKPGAADADDSDDNDDKDFPPLKPGESFHLIKFQIDGSTHIDTDALIATLPEHKGDPIDDAKIKADTDKIEKALAVRHVHGRLMTALMQREGPDHGLRVEWVIQNDDALAKAGGFWKFGGQTFSGNRALTSEQLAKAIDLKPGERVGAGSVSDARTGMEQAYDKVFPGKKVKITGKLKLTLKPVRTVNFQWQITEPPAK